MRTLEAFPHRVVMHDPVWITLSDGTRLAARIWRPEGDGKFPAILEYLPYRRRDGTAVRDYLTHPYLAGHGYASVRVDISKGISLRSSSATYDILVKCRDVKLVPAVIDAAATVGKNCALHGVTWLYEVPDAIKNGWLAKAVQQARAAAAAMAEAAGVKLGAPHRIVDESHGPSQERHVLRGAPGGYGGGASDLYATSVMRKRSVADSLENLELAPKESRLVTVRAFFAVAS